MEKLFFQSSLPRAGSTLLQNILAQNPSIYATPTSGVLELIFAARGNYTNSLFNRFNELGANVTFDQQILQQQL
jgi:hypothetical protein